MKKFRWKKILKIQRSSKLFFFTRNSARNRRWKKLFYIFFSFRVNNALQKNLFNNRDFNAIYYFSINCSQPLYLRTRKKKRAKRARSTQGWGWGLRAGVEGTVYPAKSLSFCSGIRLSPGAPNGRIFPKMSEVSKMDINFSYPEKVRERWETIFSLENFRGSLSSYVWLSKFRENARQYNKCLSEYHRRKTYWSEKKEWM